MPVSSQRASVLNSSPPSPSTVTSPSPKSPSKRHSVLADPFHLGKDEKLTAGTVANVATFVAKTRRKASVLRRALKPKRQDSSATFSELDDEESVMYGRPPPKLASLLVEACQVGAPPKKRNSRLTTSISEKAPVRGSFFGEKKSKGRLMQELAHDEVGTIVRKFMVRKCGHALIAWRQHFDPDGTNHVDGNRFCAGMAELGFRGNARTAFDVLEREGKMGTVSIYDICKHGAELWNSWCKWAGVHFVSAEDMVRKLSGEFRQNLVDTVDKATLHVTRAQFVQNSIRLGWYGWYEGILFSALDIRKQEELTVADMRWFEQARWNAVKKSGGKSPRKSSGQDVVMRTKVNAKQSLESFSRYAHLLHGNLFHAWRYLLDPQGNMTIQRKDLFRTCREIGWMGDTSALWLFLDEEDTGQTAIENFAPGIARTLALFKNFVVQNFENTKNAFREMAVAAGERPTAKFLAEDQWVAACAKFGLGTEFKEVFSLVDYEDKKFVGPLDLKFLDAWNPPEWLKATPSQQSAEEFKQLLEQKYGHILKAWRLKIDKDGAGKVNFKHFRQAAYNVGFSGDYAAAWAALDDDASGFITLAELDTESAYSLVEFRHWAHYHYGDVYTFFRTLDQDKSGDLTVKEVLRAVKKKGCKLNVEILFKSLDADGSGTLGTTEVAFLDDWDLADLGWEPADEEVDEDASSSASSGGEAAQAAEALQSVSQRLKGGGTSPRRQLSGSTGEESMDPGILVRGIEILHLLGWNADDKAASPVRSTASSSALSRSMSPRLRSAAGPPSFQSLPAVSSAASTATMPSPQSKSSTMSPDVAANRLSPAQRLLPACAPAPAQFAPIHTGGLPYRRKLPKPQVHASRRWRGFRRTVHLVPPPVVHQRNDQATGIFLTKQLSRAQEFNTAILEG